MSSPAGALINRIRFERRSDASDEYGNTLSTWTTLLTVWAGFRATPGREALEAGRLESTMTGTVMLRRSTDSLGILPSDRGVFVAGPYTGRTFNIRSIVPSADNSMIEMTIEEGVST